MYAVFYGSTFLGGGFFGGNVSGGKGDNPPGPKIFKPTGLLERKKKNTPVEIQTRIEETQAIHEEAVATIVAKASQLDISDAVIEQMALDSASLMDMDRRIAVLLAKHLRTDEENMILLVLMAAGAAQ